MFPILETERLHLREITPDDAPAIFRCFSDQEVTRYYGQEAFTTLEQAEQLIDLFAKNRLERRGIRWGIELKDRKGLVGTIGFNAWAPKHKRAEIGYELHPDYWRQGYAREAASAVLSFGFQQLGLDRVGAVVFIDNKASHALLIRLGFEMEGVLRKYIHQNGKSYDTNVYSLIH
ncbi:GNAT family N-acetyltransferase [Paenibacillus ihbetae]|uniref:GNAT family N-acetyltransferase n=1 Tax=Paenibacillus ihbetae TaxID=1870820 RepID=A0A1B2DVI9_9BACL|nr:GNAT family N-acetyltransferase [Paenibacillus ihbetae]ANY71724.1 GNAT family N-acetyltransferase [Paenibacillus ihbetae]OOC60972.1 GNAT family N-acetyltransferase [Paenibacillus ihbetae]